MKIFLSWSKPRSRAVAEALNDWLKRVIQAVKPFYSPNIEKGSNWSNELDAELKDTGFGIICLTPGNLDSTWIHFEAGALYKTPGAMIWTFLHGVNPGNVPQPLGKFQHTVAEKEDVYRLLMSINGKLAEVGGSPLDFAILRDTFERYWPDLEGKLKAAESIDTTVEKPREEKDILREILETVRNQQRITGSSSRTDIFEDSWLPTADIVSYYRVMVPGVYYNSYELNSEILTEISNYYPGVSLTSDAMGDTTYFNLFFKEPPTSPAIRDILDIIEKKAGVTGIQAKSMRVKSRFPT